MNTLPLVRSTATRRSLLKALPALALLPCLLFAAPHASAQAAPLQVQMKSITFEPKTLVVTAGQSVVWTNVSLVDHSATSNVAGTFDTGMIDPQETSAPITFNTPGRYVYHCVVHGRTMSGTIVVQ